MGVVTGSLLATSGAWLLLYRLAMLRMRFMVEILTAVVAGASLALLSPLLWWPGYPYGGIILGLIGLVLSVVHPYFTAVIVSMTLATTMGAMSWQAGLCAVLPEDYFAGTPLSWHPLLLLCWILVLVPALSCLPRVAGPHSLIFASVPLLAGLQLTVALADLPVGFEGLSLDALLAEAPCRPHSEPVRHTLAAWLAITLAAVLLQLALAIRAKRKAAAEAGDQARPGSSMMSLLMPKTTEEDGPGGMPRPGGDGEANNRYRVIQRAIGSTLPVEELPDLSDVEKQIVKICRENSFERDRVLWGGGLI